MKRVICSFTILILLSACSLNSDCVTIENASVKNELAKYIERIVELNKIQVEMDEKNKSKDFKLTDERIKNVTFKVYKKRGKQQIIEISSGVDSLENIKSVKLMKGINVFFVGDANNKIFHTKYNCHEKLNLKYKLHDMPINVKLILDDKGKIIDSEHHPLLQQSLYKHPEK